jgi:predicted RNA-binding protein YlxR (DUF448 family)
MLRFALSADDVVTPDILRKLPGRGAWTRLDRAVVRKAVAKKAFSRGFRREAKADPGLPDLVDRLLEEDALRFLSMVNKAGLIVAGALKVDSAIRARNVVALLNATDGAADGARKLDRLVRGVFGEQQASVARINLFPSRQLDLALGRSNVIHAALAIGPASSAFVGKAARLATYRSSEAYPATAETEADEGLEAAASTEQSQVGPGVTGFTHERNEQ